MEVTLDKHQRRLERKKKKLSALANLMKTHNKEQQNERNKNNVNGSLKLHRESIGPMITVKNNDSDMTQVTSQSKSQCQSKKEEIKTDKNENCNKTIMKSDEEPLRKKAKVNEFYEDTFDEVLMSDMEYAGLKKEIKHLQRQRQRQSNTFKLKLKDVGHKASLSFKDNERTPIFLTDLQHLVMWALLGKHSPCTPERWCNLENNKNISQILVLNIEGLSLYDYLQNEEKFTEVSSLFEHHVEVIMPPSKDACIMEELAKVPLTCVQAEKLINKYGSLEAAIEMDKDPTLLINNIFPVANIPITEEANKLHPDDKFPRTKLLLSALQMVEEGYPVPLRGELHKNFSSYSFTKSQYHPVTNKSPMYGVDCEMCKTALGCNELTRISIVDENFTTVYETLVRPANKIIDYLTPFSGITPEIMMTVTKTLKEVQQEIKNLLPDDAILVGQSLNCDLNAMRMMHPYVIDTSVCFNITGVRRRKSKLRKLVLKYLQETIQERDGGHDSVEDSISCLKLVKKKLANNLEFGDEILLQKKRLHDIMYAAAGDVIRNNLFAHLVKTEKRTSLITAKPLPEPLSKLLKTDQLINDMNTSRIIRHLLMPNNSKVARKVRKVASKNALTLADINLTIEQVLPYNISSTLDDVTKWINDSWQAITPHTLFIVILGNAAGCASGVAMLTIKQFAKEQYNSDESSNATDSNDNDNDNGRGKDGSDEGYGAGDNKQ